MPRLLLVIRSQIPLGIVTKQDASRKIKAANGGERFLRDSRRPSHTAANCHLSTNPTRGGRHQYLTHVYHRGEYYPTGASLQFEFGAPETKLGPSLLDSSHSVILDDGPLTDDQIKKI